MGGAVRTTTKFVSSKKYDYEKEHDRKIYSAHPREASNRGFPRDDLQREGAQSGKQKWIQHEDCQGSCCPRDTCHPW